MLKIVYELKTKKQKQKTKYGNMSESLKAKLNRPILFKKNKNKKKTLRKCVVTEL